MKRLLGVTMHQNQTVKHTTLLDNAVDVGIKLDKRRLKEAPSSHGQPHLPGDSVEFTAAIFKGLVQPFVDGFLKGFKDETHAGAHEPVCGWPLDPERDQHPSWYEY